MELVVYSFKGRVMGRRQSFNVCCCCKQIIGREVAFQEETIDSLWQGVTVDSLCALKLARNTFPIVFVTADPGCLILRIFGTISAGVPTRSLAFAKLQIGQWILTSHFL